jgi:hypothetical protein
MSNAVHPDAADPAPVTELRRDPAPAAAYSDCGRHILAGPRA